MTGIRLLANWEKAEVRMILQGRLVGPELR